MWDLLLYNKTMANYIYEKGGYQTLDRRSRELWSKTSELRESGHHRSCHLLKL